MTLSLLCLLGVLLLASCSSRQTAPTPERQGQPIYILQPGTPSPPQQEAPAVFFQGAFAHMSVPWVEGLRLAEAILLAEYQSPRDPIEIVVLRNGQPYRINAGRLLRGQENPLLEPGDVIQILR